MSHSNLKPAPIPTAEQLILEEAQRIARSVRTPGQTKEQTKLVAQGIAKGIELYKKQQSAKARERDKSEKRSRKLKQVQTNNSQLPPNDTCGDAPKTRGIAALITAGTLFAVMALIHLWRAISGWNLTLGPWTIPAWISLAAAAMLTLLSVWLFKQATSSP